MTLTSWLAQKLKLQLFGVTYRTFGSDEAGVLQRLWYPMKKFEAVAT